MKRVRVTVPATIDGLGPGAGILGLTLALIDTVEVELDAESTEISGDETICAAYRSWPADQLPGARFTLTCGIPPNTGLGEETAHIVAGLAVAIAATEAKDARRQMFQLALRHGARPAQLAACVMGGLTTALPDGDALHGLHVADHLAMGVALFLPDEPLSLPKPKPDPARLAYLLTALVWGRWDWIESAMRSSALPEGVKAVLAAAHEAGAYGAAPVCAGPALFALTPHGQGEPIAQAMGQRAEELGLQGKTLSTTVREPGVEVKVQ